MAASYDRLWKLLIDTMAEKTKYRALLTLARV